MMEELPITVQRSKCLITGYGRIGKVLAQRLGALGADVAVAARSVESLAWIKASGYKPLQIQRRENLVGRYDVIINTIPTLLFDAHILRTDSGKYADDRPSHPNRAGLISAPLRC